MSDKTTFAKLENRLWDALRAGEESEALELLDSVDLSQFRPRRIDSLTETAFENGCPDAGRVIIEQSGDLVGWTEMIREWVLDGRYDLAEAFLKTHDPEQTVEFNDLYDAPAVLKDLLRAGVELKMADQQKLLETLYSTLTPMLDDADRTPEQLLECAYATTTNWNWELFKNAVEAGDRQRAQWLIDTVDGKLDPGYIKLLFDHDMGDLVYDQRTMTADEQHEVLKTLVKKRPDAVRDFIDDGVIDLATIKDKTQTTFATTATNAYEHGHIELFEMLVARSEVEAESVLQALMDDPAPGRPKGVSLSDTAKEQLHVRAVRSTLEQIGTLDEKAQAEAFKAFLNRPVVQYGRVLSALYEHGARLENYPAETLDQTGADVLEVLCYDSARDRDVRYALDTVLEHDELSNDERYYLLRSLLKNDRGGLLVELFERHGDLLNERAGELIRTATAEGECEVQRYLLERYDTIDTDAFAAAVGRGPDAGFDPHRKRDCEHHGLILLEQLFEAGHRPDYADRLYESLNESFNPDSQAGPVHYEKGVRIACRYRCLPSQDHINELEEFYSERAELVKEHLPGRTQKARELQDE